MKRIINDVVNDDYSIKSCFSDFLVLKESQGKSKSTIKSYEKNTKDFFEYCESVGVSVVSGIDKYFVDDYKLHLVHKDISDSSKASYLTHIKAFLRYLMNEGLIPIFEIKAFRTPAKEIISIYTDDEIRRLLACDWRYSKSFEKLRAYSMTATFIYTGLRRASIMNLKIKDIDFENKLISISHIKRENRMIHKVIPLNPELEVIIKQYIRKTPLSKYSGDNYLFPNVSNRKMLDDSANKIVRKMCEYCKVEFRGLHEFRRSFASNAHKLLDGDLLTVQKLMLLSDSRVLTEHYINLDADRLQEASKKLSFNAYLTKNHVLKMG